MEIGDVSRFELIDKWLLGDLQAPRKQHRTAKRVWRRLLDEHGVEVAETTVRDHVRKRRRELGLAAREVFVPQVHAPGHDLAAYRTYAVDEGQQLRDVVAVPPVSAMASGARWRR